MIPDYTSVTEISGTEITQEQLERLYHRYYWAGTYCDNKDVLEVACGVASGIGYIATKAKSISAGDYSEKILAIARQHYGKRFDLKQFDAQTMPFAANSKDTILLFEALYYLPSADRFVNECKRILRDEGTVLLVTANKDIYDFNPSPFTFVYYGVVELKQLFEKHGFSVQCFGYSPIKNMSLRQKILRPIKKLAVYLNLIPKTMAGKKFFKKIIFGQLMPMPSELKEDMINYKEPVLLPIDKPDIDHKVIYCVAKLSKI